MNGEEETPNKISDQKYCIKGILYTEEETIKSDKILQNTIDDFNMGLDFVYIKTLPEVNKISNHLSLKRIFITLIVRAHNKALADYTFKVVAYKLLDKTAITYTSTTRLAFWPIASCRTELELT